MAINERVRRSIEFQYGVDAEDLIKGTTVAENSIEGLEAKLQTLKGEFASVEIGSQRFNELGNEIQATQSKLKTLDERFEGLGIEQKNAMIVDSFNVVAGTIGVVAGTLVAFGVKSEVLDDVEKRLLGIITVVSSLREVSNGLAAFNKLWPTLTANITRAAAALRAFALANPFTAIAAGVVAVTAAVYALIKAQEEEVKSIEEVTKAYEERNNRYEKAIGLRNREAELEIQRVEREQGAIAAAEKRVQLYEDLAFQALYQTTVADEETAAAVKRQEQIVKGLEEEIAARQQQSDFGQKISNLLGDEIDLTEKLKKAKQDLFDLNSIFANAELNRLQAEENLAAARLKLEEERKKKREEARDKAEKAAEDLAKRAVKQLEDQRQATEDLINLYTELYPEKVTGGQFEFNTELDKTNFQLQEQLDILFALNTEYEDLADQLEEINFEESVSFFSQEQLAVFKKLRDANKTELQLQLDNLDATYREDLALFSDNEEMKLKITEQYEEDKAKLRRQYAIKTAQDVIGITSNFLNVLADINQQSLELQLLQAAGNQAAIDKINADALEKQKKLRIAQTLITTAESILNGFNATSTLPPPFNLIAGGVLAAAYTALGAKTIQTISATTLEGGGSTGGGFQNIPSGGGFSLPGGGGVPVGGSQGAVLPGLGGGRLGTPTMGTVAQEPIRAYVLAGDVENGVQANFALNNRRRLAG